ncbi:MAG: hypothetical protein JKY94_17430 [Rhodobacteraceae bacterium]|nr:hypothetical protein [Paracoccaceae bacterium]
MSQEGFEALLMSDPGESVWLLPNIGPYPQEAEDFFTTQHQMATVELRTGVPFETVRRDMGHTFKVAPCLLAMRPPLRCDSSMVLELKLDDVRVVLLTLASRSAGTRLPKEFPREFAEIIETFERLQQA